MKILHLPTETGGNAWGLSRGERELGLHSDVLVEKSSRINYPSDINLGLDQKPRFLPSKLNKAHSFSRKLAAFLKFRSKYDIFHFNFGKSLLHSTFHPLFYQFELPYYPRNSKLFVTYNGSDARLFSPRLPRDLEKEIAVKKESIKKMGDYVEWMWAVNPDLINFLPPEKSSFLPYSIANFKVDPAYPKIDGKLKIVHAPTNQRLKGSAFVLEAIDKLRKKYAEKFEFQLIEGVSYKQALEMYRQADLVIDQLLIGWYGAFAVEVMLMAKPVIVFIAEEDLKHIPKEMENQLLDTIINANPTNIYEILEKCLLNRELLLEKAAASIEYAAKWHHPTRVADITKEKYEQCRRDATPSQ